MMRLVAEGLKVGGEGEGVALYAGECEGAV
jgi:hypothetical protein